MRQRPVQWRDFMMRFELGLEAPDPKRALQSALTISVVATLSALVVFGYVKGHFTGARPLRSSLQTTVIAGLAAAAAFAIARAIS